MGGVESEVALEVVALRCPLTQRRLRQPCRTRWCEHAAAFCSTSVPHLRALADGSLACPVCSVTFRSPSELVVDERLTIFLSEHASQQGAAVVRQADGSFAYSLARPPKPRPRPPRRAAASQVVNARAEDGTREPDPDAVKARLGASGEEPRPRDFAAAAPAERSRSAAMIELMARFVPAATSEIRQPAAALGSPDLAAQLEAVQHAADSADVYAALTLCSDEAPSRPTATWFCEDCAEPCVGDRTAHARTIAHQFARSVAAVGGGPTVHLALPSGNVGYRMLRDQLGWEEGRGLGKGGQGALQPIATRLKRDRHGLRVMAPADDDDDDDYGCNQDGGGVARPAAMAQLRVTHPSTEVMGSNCHVRPLTRAERRQRARQVQRAAQYAQRCKELLVQRQLTGLTTRPT